MAIRSIRNLQAAIVADFPWLCGNSTIGPVAELNTNSPTQVLNPAPLYEILTRGPDTSAVCEGSTKLSSSVPPSDRRNPAIAVVERGGLPLEATSSVESDYVSRVFRALSPIQTSRQSGVTQRLTLFDGPT